MEETRKRTKFSELDDSQKLELSRKCFKIVLATNFRKHIMKEKFNIASPAFIVDKAEYYYNNHANANEKKEYDEKREQFEKLKVTNGLYFNVNTLYREYIETIANRINTNEELELYLKGDNPSRKEIPIHSLNLAMEDGERALGHIDDVYRKAKNRLNEYIEYKRNRRVEINKIKTERTNEENLLIAKVTLSDYLEGLYTSYTNKKEYCHIKKLSPNTFDKRLFYIKENDLEWYTNFNNELNVKREGFYKELYPVVNNIITRLNNNDYTQMDYYMDYKDLYSFKDLCDACMNYNFDIRVLKKFFSGFDVRTSLTKENFIDQYYEVNGIVYNEEDKNKIYDFAKEYSIPFNWTNVHMINVKLLNDKVLSSNNIKKSA